jgi:multimeric flavodoxin WrbA
MVKIVVIYHSGYGHTARLAEYVAQGADAELIAIDADGNISDDSWIKLDKAEGIIFGSPTYMGGVSWQFKKFAEASSKRWYARDWQNKIFGGFSNSANLNGDKQITLIYLQTLAAQHGGIWVSLGILPSSTKSANRNDNNYLGACAGALAQTPSDASVAEMFNGDLETGKLYGQRIAKIAELLFK